ncbi:MAG: hypothetical protein RL156_66 [Bacteroidota bacterium]
MKFRLLCVVLLALSWTSQNAFAQDEEDVSPLSAGKAPPRIYMGPIVGYNRVMNSGGFPSFSNDVNCPTFTDGSGNGLFFGWAFEYLLGDPKTSKSSIVTRVIYDNLPSSFTQYGDRLPSLVRDAANNRDTVIFTTTQHVAEIKYTTIDLDIMYRFNLGATPLGLTAGISPGFAMTQQAVQKFELVQPVNARFIRVADTVANKPLRYENFDRTAIIRDEDIKNASAFRFALKFGVQYEIILRKLTLIPSLHYNVGLTNMTTTDSWKINALQAAIEARFAL